MASGPRILLTGAGGFVGRHMVPALRLAFTDATLIAGGRETEVPGTDARVRLDLMEPAGLPDAVAEARPDFVIHLAAQADVALGFRDPVTTWSTNAIGTVALGEAVLRAAPAAGFVFASSGEVYGLSFQAGRPLDEDAPLVPANPYAASKAAADLAIGELALRGLRATRIRAFTHTGPGQMPAFVVPAFARQVARIEAGKQEPVIRTGALERWRDFLDVRDVCAAYVAVLRARPVPGAFNICRGVSRRVGDILDALLELADISAQVEQADALLRPTDVMRVQGNPERASRLLGWAPSVPWEETLTGVLNDWRVRVRLEE